MWDFAAIACGAAEYRLLTKAAARAFARTTSLGDRNWAGSGQSAIRVIKNNKLALMEAYVTTTARLAQSILSTVTKSRQEKTKSSNR